MNLTNSELDGISLEVDLHLISRYLRKMESCLINVYFCLFVKLKSTGKHPRDKVPSLFLESHVITLESDPEEFSRKLKMAEKERK